ncbi:MAG: peptidylprolyl isomerase [Pirellulales bacterium]|nr:peptidylprolyl isomerase [Pirellulales bacterium]
MVKHRSCRGRQPSLGLLRSPGSQRLFRNARFEPLEERRLLAAPQLVVEQDVVLYAGAALHITLDGFDADGDALTYSVVSDNPDLTATIPQGNQSLRLSVQDHGDMVFELFEDRVPHTTARIIELVDSGYYDGKTFHRIIDDFMIQGGSSDGQGYEGSGVTFDDEFHLDLQHTNAGVLSMANSGPDTNDAQFFITDAATRWLDFEHTIFGHLTDGDDVRQAITQVPTTDNTPDTPVVIDSAEVFTDTENAVLMLSAPEGTFDQATVTVTVSDGQNTVQRHLQVSILPDTFNTDYGNSEPFLLPIEDIHTTVDTPITVNLPAADAEGDPIFYRGTPSPWDPEVAIEVSQSTGVATITPSGGLVGVYEVYIEVFASADDLASDLASDSQVVPVMIHPAAPTGLELLASSDTGPKYPNETDGITNPANTDAEALKFRVYGVLEDAVVTLYANGAAIGEGTVTGDAVPADSIVITASGAADLADGLYSITAVQTLSDQAVDVGNRNDTVDLASEASGAIQITLDTVAPQFLSDPVETAQLGMPYVYDVQTSEEAGGRVTYSLTGSPSPTGMQINATTGRITWTPQSGQGPSQTITVLAVDAAGNEARQELTIQVKSAPIFDPIGNQTVQEGSWLAFTVSATDPADPTAVLQYGVAPPAPEGSWIDPATGVFQWKPAEAQGPGTYPVTLQVTNPDTDTQTTKTIQITVEEVNTAPVLDPIADREVSEGELLQFTVGVTDPDVPENQLTFSLHGNVPAGAVIDPATGRFTFTPSELQGGESYSLMVRVTDAADSGDPNSFDEQTFAITVKEVDHPPVFDAIGKQFLAPGDELRLEIRAFDPDVPTHPVVLSLDPGAPEGAALDPQTNVLTWHVPEDIAMGNFRLVVHATELIDGQPGLSSETAIEVSVFDARAVAVVEDLFTPATAARSTPSATDVLLASLDAPVERPAETPRPNVASPTGSADILGEGELFGVHIGPWTGLGGGLRQPQENQDGGNSDRNEKANDRQNDERGGQSHRRAPAANDAVLASLVPSRGRQ